MGGRVSDLVASARKSAAGPLLEHLRFVESLPMLELDEVEDLLAALDLDADERSVLVERRSGRSSALSSAGGRNAHG